MAENLLVWRALKRIRPHDGWMAFILTWAALLGAAVGVHEARWVLDDAYRLFFFKVTLAGGLVGLLLSRSRLIGWRAALIAGIGGLSYVVNAVGRVFPPWTQLLAEWGYLSQWLQQGWAERDWGPIPFQSLVVDSWGRLASLVGRLVQWWKVVRAGEMSRDNVSFLLLAGLVFWAATVFAIWGVYRWRRPLTGLLPGSAMLAISVYHSGEGLSYLLMVLACGTFLVPWMRFLALTESWEQRGVDYSPEVWMEVVLVGLALACTVVVGAVLTPSISIPQVARWAWGHWPDAWKSTDEGIWRAFGGVRRPRLSGEGGIPQGLAGLPRAHLLGGSVDLTRQPVMTVTTDDPPIFEPDTFGPYELFQVPQYYWRALTFDRYTGHGWENGTLDGVRYDAGQPMPGDHIRGRRELRQVFAQFALGDQAAYAAGEPRWLDVPVEALWRGPDDLAGLERTTVAREYAVLSLVPDIAQGTLRKMPPDYPSEIVEQYLQLPDSLPQRVLDLAQEVTADAPTSYDKALALQTYLRQFDYSLDLDPPPQNQDVVDYFLFDIQTGYCDYYASAMVVMARAVGLPARLAMGYATGSYDLDRRHYYVVEADAHSWPEVYFSGYGWIEFEPTAAQSPFGRESVESFPDLSALPLPPRSPATRGLINHWAWAGVGMILLGLVLWLAWVRWPRLARLSGPVLMATIYRRLARHGLRFDVLLRSWDTPSEYGHRLGLAIARRAARSRWMKEALAAQAQLATAHLMTLERTYLKATYSPYPLTEGERRTVLDAWRGLGSRLWLIWLSAEAAKSSP